MKRTACNKYLVLACILSAAALSACNESSEWNECQKGDVICRDGHKLACSKDDNGGYVYIQVEDTDGKCTVKEEEKPECTAGTYRCEKNTLYACVNDVWKESKACGKLFCNSQSGQCDNGPDVIINCDKTDNKCENGILTVCNEETGKTESSICPSLECDGSVCKSLCEDDETKCEGDDENGYTLSKCVDGEWVADNQVCEFCSEDGKSCVEKTCSYELNGETVTMHDGDSLCDNDKIVRCDFPNVVEAPCKIGLCDDSEDELTCKPRSCTVSDVMTLEHGSSACVDSKRVSCEDGTLTEHDCDAFEVCADGETECRPGKDCLEGAVKHLDSRCDADFNVAQCQDGTMVVAKECNAAAEEEADRTFCSSRLECEKAGADDCAAVENGHPLIANGDFWCNGKALVQCVNSAVELSKICSGDTPVCDTNACRAYKNCEDGSEVIAHEQSVCFDDPVATGLCIDGRLTRDEGNGCLAHQICVIDEEHNQASCQCDEENNWTDGESGCVCASGTILINNECVTKTTCNAGEVLDESTNTCACDTAHGYIVFEDNCVEKAVCSTDEVYNDSTNTCLKAGDIITFGHYEQDDDTTNGKEPISWRILDVKDGKAFVVSEKILDAQPYNSANTAVTWEKSSIRNWLNESPLHNHFFDTVFSVEEKARIVPSVVITDPLPGYENVTDHCNPTIDKIFLLSLDEVKAYLVPDTIAEATRYAYNKGKSNGALFDCSESGEGLEKETHCAGHWWLRTPGIENNSVSLFNGTGGFYDGAYVSATASIRPAMWVLLDSSQHVCGAGEIYDESTSSCVCDTDNGFVLLNGGCALKVLCKTNEYYEASTNSCIPKVICGEHEVYDETTNTCVCDTDNLWTGTAGSCICNGFLNASGACDEITICEESMFYNAATNECDEIATCGEHEVYYSSTNVCLKAGNTITFGHYEQDDNTTNGSEPINWRILDVKNGKVLIVSEKILDTHPYHSANTAVTWEQSSIREWLNVSHFFDAAFSTEEQAKIAHSVIINVPLSGDVTDPCEPTFDKIFLLSPDETKTYLGSDLKAEATHYTYNKGGAIFDCSESGDGLEKETHCFGHWWLRTPGSTIDPTIINGGGYYSHGSVAGNGSVRPALWMIVDPGALECRLSEIFDSTSRTCACDTANHWTGTAGSCTCDGVLNTSGVCVPKASCTTDELYNEETNTCIPKATCGTGEVYDESTNTCACDTDHGYIIFEETCVAKAVCSTGEVYNDATNACDCDTANNYIVHGGACVPKATCGTDKFYNADTNECDEIATCTTDEFYYAVTNTCLKVGDTFTFGRYEQDNVTTNGKEPIDWIVLKIDAAKGKVFVISQKALDVKPYNETDIDITWEKSTLRSWLNGYNASSNLAEKDFSKSEDNFLDIAFSTTEQAQIAESVVSADKSSSYPNNDSGNATKDKIYLLSSVEANERDFRHSPNSKAAATPYAQANGARILNNYTYYWVRTPGIYQNYAAHITHSGSIVFGGAKVTATYVSVRPVLWMFFDPGALVCGSNETYNSASRTCACDTDNLWTGTPGSCTCSGFLNASGVCVPKASCSDHEVYNETTNTCACDADNLWTGTPGSCTCSGFLNASSECVPIAHCTIEEFYEASTNTCVPKATCGTHEVYDETTNTCACDTDNLWTGTAGSCICNGFLEGSDCVPKTICGTGEIYYEDTNTCSCVDASHCSCAAGYCPTGSGECGECLG